MWQHPQGAARGRAGPDHHRADQSSTTTSTVAGAATPISMAIRTLCFIGAVSSAMAGCGGCWSSAAFVLPYIAVVMANGASPRIEGADLVPPDHGYKELGG